MHIYCKLVSKCNYKGVKKNLMNRFHIPLYKMIFDGDPPFMSREAMETVLELVDWFASPNGTYLRVFSGHKSPHMLLRYAIDKLVM